MKGIAKDSMEGIGLCLIRVQTVWDTPAIRIVLVRWIGNLFRPIKSYSISPRVTECRLQGNNILLLKNLKFKPQKLTNSKILILMMMNPVTSTTFDIVNFLFLLHTFINFNDFIYVDYFWYCEFSFFLAYIHKFWELSDLRF